MANIFEKMRNNKLDGISILEEHLTSSIAQLYIYKVMLEQAGRNEEVAPIKEIRDDITMTRNKIPDIFSYVGK